MKGAAVTGSCEKLFRVPLLLKLSYQTLNYRFQPSVKNHALLVIPSLKTYGLPIEEFRGPLFRSISSETTNEPRNMWSSSYGFTKPSTGSLQGLYFWCLVVRQLNLRLFFGTILLLCHKISPTPKHLLYSPWPVVFRPSGKSSSSKLYFLVSVSSRGLS